MPIHLQNHRTSNAELFSSGTTRQKLHTATSFQKQRNGALRVSRNRSGDGSSLMLGGWLSRPGSNEKPPPRRQRRHSMGALSTPDHHHHNSNDDEDEGGRGGAPLGHSSEHVCTGMTVQVESTTTTTTTTLPRNSTGSHMRRNGSLDTSSELPSSGGSPPTTTSENRATPSLSSRGDRTGTGGKPRRSSSGSASSALLSGSGTRQKQTKTKTKKNMRRSSSMGTEATRTSLWGNNNTTNHRQRLHSDTSTTDPLSSGSENSHTIRETLRAKRSQLRRSLTTSGSATPGTAATAPAAPLVRRQLAQRLAQLDMSDSEQEERQN